MSTTITKIRPSELVSKKREDLYKQLEELKQELASLRVHQVTGGNSSRLHKIVIVRKNIARVLTVINHKTRASVREVLAKKSKLPTDLRAKKTRAIRRRLTKFERTRTTEKARKVAIHFPKRNYAVKA